MPTSEDDIPYGSSEGFALPSDLQSWVPEIPGTDHNVVIVGGGQNGLAFAFALRRANIGKVVLIDQASDESQAGVWLTRARMKRLRTPKSVPGPELGVRELSFQSWFEARYGADAYDSFDRIATADWAEYLRWYRGALDIPVRYGTRLLRIEPVGPNFRLHLEIDGKLVIETTRKIILANGVAGSGGPVIPPLLADLPASHFAHTSDRIDFGPLKDRDVAVVGAAASAFDAAAVALEQGARSVHLFVRRAQIASIPIYRNRFYPGAFEHYAHLPDRIRWQQALIGQAVGSTPPGESVDRATRHPNFHLHLSAPWQSATLRNGRIEAVVRDETFGFDFVIAGTGYATDLSRRPELSDLAPHIRLWRDQYEPLPGEESPKSGLHPYLGLAHEFLEKIPGALPALANVHVYNPGAYLSFGLPSGDIWTMRRDIPLIVKRIGQDLFLQDIAHHEARLTAPVPPEFGPDRYARAIWRGRPQETAPAPQAKLPAPVRGRAHAPSPPAAEAPGRTAPTRPAADGPQAVAAAGNTG